MIRWIYISEAKAHGDGDGDSCLVSRESHSTTSCWDNRSGFAGATATPATIPRVTTATLRSQLQHMESCELAHAGEIKNAKAAAKANELRATTAEAVAKIAEANYQRLVTSKNRREDAARAAAALPAIPTVNPPYVYQLDVVGVSPP